MPAATIAKPYHVNSLQTIESVIPPKVKKVLKEKLNHHTQRCKRHSLEYMSALASLMDIYAIFGRSDDTIFTVESTVWMTLNACPIDLLIY